MTGQARRASPTWGHLKVCAPNNANSDKPRAQNRRLRPGGCIEKQLFHVQLFREAGSREGKAGCPLGGP